MVDDEKREDEFIEEEIIEEEIIEEEVVEEEVVEEVVAEESTEYVESEPAEAVSGSSADEYTDFADAENAPGMDTYSETVTTRPAQKQGYFDRLKSAIGGIFFGIILFLVAAGLLFWNEGRTNYANIAESAVPVDAAAPVKQDLQGKLVSIAGAMTTDEKISDDQYLKPDNYLAVDRNVEMYSWVERKSVASSKKNPDGSETKTYKYDYYKEWKGSPASASSFKKPQGHQNPKQIINNLTKKASQAKIGNYKVDLNELDLKGYQALTPSAELLSTRVRTSVSAPEIVETKDASGKIVKKKLIKKSKLPLISGNELYIGSGNISTPSLGDYKISYKVIKPGLNAHIFGKLSGDTISKFTNDKGKSLFRMDLGTQEQALADMKSEHSSWTWILRGIGFLVMLVGLNMVFAPICAVVDFIPIVRGATKFIVKTVAFIIAAAVSLAVILISIIVHNPVYLAITLVILFLIIAGGIGLAVFAFKKYGESK